MTDEPKKKRGFAALTPEMRREIAAQGGKAIPPEKRAFSNRELASKAGQVGGTMVKPETRSFSADRELAVRVGREGGLKRQEAARAKLKEEAAVEAERQELTPSHGAVSSMSNNPVPRLLPAPWSVQEIAGGFVVVDAGGRRLAYVHADPDQRGANTDMLTPDEARRVAVNIARLPEFMREAVKSKASS